ncbi:MAG: AAA family ATPase [Clostridiales bacterium]|jgi:uridine kinase|nr:AAA family ATPase [Clostridiales bacterium]
MQRLIEKINDLLKTKTPVVIAIDGPCGSGKTTLAKTLSEIYEDSAVVHVDDFFLRPHQRSAQRLSAPGGNVDRERLADQVLSKLREQKNMQYERYDCQTEMMSTQDLPARKLCIIEGSYSHHPDIVQHYDLRVYLDIDPEKQVERLKQRVSPDMLQKFIDTWILLEQNYFTEYQIKASSDLVLKT